MFILCLKAKAEAEASAEESKTAEERSLEEQEAATKEAEEAAAQAERTAAAAARAAVEAEEADHLAGTPPPAYIVDIGMTLNISDVVIPGNIGTCSTRECGGFSWTGACCPPGSSLGWYGLFKS